MILEIEIGSTRSPSVENRLWKWLWTCRKADCRMIMTNSRIKEAVYEHLLFRFVLFSISDCRFTRCCISEGGEMNFRYYDILRSHMHLCLMLIIKQVVYLHAHSTYSSTGYMWQSWQFFVPAHKETVAIKLSHMLMCSCLSYGNGNVLKLEHVFKEFVLFLIVD